MEIVKLFRESFGVPPVHRVQAPGRLEVLGNHTDYNEGLVLSIAVDRYVQMAAAPRPDGKIELVSSAFPGRVLFYADRLERDATAPWADYIKGVLAQLRARRVLFTGFNAAVHSTVPVGAGLGSSAALAVATALAVRQLYPYKLTETGLTTPARRDREGKLPPPEPEEKKWMARLCQRAEEEFTGVRCGLLDQFSCLFGRAQHLMAIDFQFLTVENHFLPPEVALAVCHSGVKHQLADGAYNRLREGCDAAARKLGFNTLRRVSPGLLEKSARLLFPFELACARHVVGETQRVVFAERALRAEDLEQFGQYLYQSHESSRDQFGNSTPELDHLVELARRHPACLGARLTGGGFGGATINLVRQAELIGFLEQMRRAYRDQRGLELEAFAPRIAEGAGPLL